MNNPAISTVQDIENFFTAYNNHNWTAMFNYMSNDCVWDASEKCVVGKKNIIDYWTKFHSSFKETLGKPKHIAFVDQVVYLQVKVHLDFIEDGIFFGNPYKKGETLDFICADFYELNNEGKIKSAQVYIRFFK